MSEYELIQLYLASFFTFYAFAGRNAHKPFWGAFVNPIGAARNFGRRK